MKSAAAVPAHLREGRGPIAQGARSLACEASWAPAQVQDSDERADLSDRSPTLLLNPSAQTPYPPP